jgi:hypothetical protein
LEEALEEIKLNRTVVIFAEVLFEGHTQILLVFIVIQEKGDCVDEEGRHQFPELHTQGC